MLTLSDRIPVSAEQRREMLAFAVSVAKEAGRATLPYFRRPIHVENKLSDGSFDPVTEGDRAAENVLRQQIRMRYPAHGIFGEEFGQETGNGLTWVIDPIDGTRAFMSGMLHWGLLLALFDGQEPILGVVYQPFTDELWFGDGTSALYTHAGETTSLKCRPGISLPEATLGITNPNLIKSPADRLHFDALERRARLARYGGDCYIFCVLSMGFLDIAIEGGLQAYDVQALIPIVRGAGGVITNWAGGSAALGGNVIACGSQMLHDEAIAVLNS